MYGFEEWATPVFEDTRVFSRGLGDSSDVVSKEMYTFTDRGGDSLTLRPENTAGVCRALVSNGLAQAGLPRKVFYAGPMFRYERPQKGRYRQFHQIGVEVLGADSFALTGDLTIKGTTKSVTVEFEHTGMATDVYGNLRAGFEGKAVINRADFGVTWNAPLEAGGVLVSDKITLEFDVSAIKA